MALAALELLLLALAWAAALAVRPWRLLQGGQLASPLLGSVVILAWLWSWPGLDALGIPLQWSGAPLVTLILGWPLAVPVLTVTGLSTLLTTDATLGHALSLTVWSGLVPATLMLGLGHVVRRASHDHPMAYILGRAFLLPMAVLAGCNLVAAVLGQGPEEMLHQLHHVAAVLLAVGEASWTCAVVSLLVAHRPGWLATWSDPLSLGRPAPARVRTRRPPPPRR